MTTERLLQTTRSVCPHCLTSLSADIVQRKETVILRRQCPDHGLTEEVIWRGAPDFVHWKRPKTYNSQFARQREKSKGCPFDCGLCSQHLQKSCAVLYELTDACNLRCPVCFASSGGGEEDRGSLHSEQDTVSEGGSGRGEETLAEHLRALRWIHSQAGQAVLQLSGGEPTLSPWLLPLVREASALFPAVQLNTNGILLAQSQTLAFELAEAGLSWVFLQFDGIDDTVYKRLRGKPLFQVKQEAIEKCRRAGLAVVLVPTVAKGVNEQFLGDIVRFGVSHAPTVRGVHFQPMTRSGRNFLEQAETLTLPEVLQGLEEQSHGLIKKEHASPPGCEHERCSFHCRYTLCNGSLVHTPSSACCDSSLPRRGQRQGQAQQAMGQGGDLSEKAEYLKGAPESSDAGADRAIASVVHNWQKAASDKSIASALDSFDAFIARHRAMVFSVTCMAFQDAWNLDLQRLQGCCIHIYAQPDRLVPFCAYNLTDSSGKPLYRRKPDIK